MTEITTLRSSDYLFYYDKFDIGAMNEHDLVEYIYQPRRTMFYSRSMGAGVHEHGNYANAIGLQVGLRFDIVNALAIRNTRVVEGSNGQKDRRMALSSETIGIDQKNKEIDLTVQYVNLYNFEQANAINLPVK